MRPARLILPLKLPALSNAEVDAALNRPMAKKSLPGRGL
jgi:hypothetical protein